MIPHRSSSRELRVPALSQMGTQARVVIDHADETAAVLLDPGLGLPLEVWDPVVPLLAGTRVIRFDRPGLGGSDPWRRGCGSLDDQVTLLVSVLAATVRDPLRTPVVVVGHSSAALHVEALARAHPRLVRAMVLVDPALPGRERRHGWAGAAIPSVADWLVADPSRAERIGAAVGWAMLRFGTSDREGAARAPQAAWAALRSSSHLRAVLCELRRIGADAQLLETRAAGRPVPAGIPVTVLAATRRGWPIATPKPRWRRRLHDRAVTLSPGARVVPADGAHLLMLDDPTTVAAVIARAATWRAGPPAARVTRATRLRQAGTVGETRMRAANLSNR